MADSLDPDRYAILACKIIATHPDASMYPVLQACMHACRSSRQLQRMVSRVGNTHGRYARCDAWADARQTELQAMFNGIDRLPEAAVAVHLKRGDPRGPLGYLHIRRWMEDGKLVPISGDGFASEPGAAQPTGIRWPF